MPTFRVLAGLSGQVPLVSIVSGRCFAGNAALAGVCDVIIATPDANIGMGGPAMIEGGGLGVYPPEAIGPIDVQRHNGVVHLVARDEAHAVALAKQYLSYFQGSAGTTGRPRIRDWPDMWCRRTGYAPTTCTGRSSRSSTSAPCWSCAPTTASGSSPRWFASRAWHTALIANSSHHLGGAIDAEAADKAGDFLGLCESFRLPVISLCDTPGSWSGRTRKKKPPSADSAGCS